MMQVGFMFYYPLFQIQNSWLHCCKYRGKDLDDPSVFNKKPAGTAEEVKKELKWFRQLLVRRYASWKEIWLEDDYPIVEDYYEHVIKKEDAPKSTIKEGEYGVTKLDNRLQDFVDGGTTL